MKEIRLENIYELSEGVRIVQDKLAKNGVNYREMDWKGIREFIEANKSELLYVNAGLAEDWNKTSGLVWRFEDGYTPKEKVNVFSSSTWATPAILVIYRTGEIKSFEMFIKGDRNDSYF